MKQLTSILLLTLFSLLIYPVFAQDIKTAPKTTEGNPLFNEMHKAIIRNEYPNVHSVLVMHKGKMIYERYYTAKDEALGDDLGIVKHSKETLHDLRSVTKSIIAICVGLAIQQGKIRDEEERVMKFFPSLKYLDTGLRAELTIKHLLTMSSGMQWDENRPYTDTLNSELAMSASADPIKFVLSRPIIEQPGKTFNYNGGNTQLLGAIIVQTSGMMLDEFVKKYLFTPLGIRNYYWYRISDKSKLPAAASGLRLRSRDMMRIGTLLQNNGLLNGYQVISKSWVQKLLISHIARDDQGQGYGYQFWIFKAPGASGQYALPAAVGNGDQRIFIDRKLNLVVVITSGNYNKWDLKKASHELLSEFIYPALVQ